MDSQSSTRSSVWEEGKEESSLNHMIFNAFANQVQVNGNTSMHTPPITV
jgi:hypothetical protein